MRGSYCLILELPRALAIRVGRLGTFRFPAGTYVYAGSALGGIDARVGRHLRRRKRKRWHIDYLLAHARVADVLRIEARHRVECEMNRLALRVPGARTAVPGFGSSDCACSSHLTFWGRPPKEHPRGKPY